MNPNAVILVLTCGSVLLVRLGLILRDVRDSRRATRRRERKTAP